MNDPGYFNNELCTYIERLLDAYHIPGISVAIVDNGRTFAKVCLLDLVLCDWVCTDIGVIQGFGLARFPSTLASADTLYFTGSTTKAMVAAALGMAVHDPSKVLHKPAGSDSFSWTTPVKDVLTEDFELEDHCASEGASIEDILSHRSGLSGHDYLYGPWLGPTPREITKRVKYLGPLSQPFRTTMQYNNVMYAVAGDVLETISGMQCGQVLKKWLWEPLGMKTTYWYLRDVIDDPQLSIKKDMSRGYYWINEEKGEEETSTGGFYTPEPFIPFAGIAPAGATISSVSDYAKWMQALLTASSVTGEPVLQDEQESKNMTDPVISANLLKDLTTARVTVPMPLPRNPQMVPAWYNLGWISLPSTLGPFHPLVSHGGGLTGYGTELFLLPNDKFGVVTMGNTRGASNVVGGLIATEVIKRCMGFKKNDEVVTRAQSQALETFIRLQTAGFELDNEERRSRATERRNTDKCQLQESEPPTSKFDTKSLMLEHFMHKATDDVVQSLRQYEGTYRNVAYGEFKVTFAPTMFVAGAGSEKLRTKQITYRFRRDQQGNVRKDQIRAQTHSLRVDAIGRRTWTFIFLLHPRKRGDQSDGAGQILSDDTISFDQEYLDKHGNPEDDVVPGLPTGCEGDADPRCRQEVTWESVLWTKLGACLTTRNIDNTAAQRMSAGDDLVPKPTRKLGLTLANAHIEESASREKGWEKKMIWFERTSY